MNDKAWDQIVENMMNNNNWNELKQRIKELYSIIWLLVYSMPEHQAEIPMHMLYKLDSSACFTTWEKLDTKQLIIRAFEGKSDD